MTYEQVLWVVDHGIRSILTVREKRLTDSWLRSIDHHFLKVEDFDAPSVEQLDNAVGYIKKQMANGKAVLVHCSEGKGRTGTVLAAYYVKEENLTATQAIEKIKNRRPNSVESPIQKERIEAYEQYLISKKDRKGI